MLPKTKILQRQDAELARMALLEVVARLRAKGADAPAQRLSKVAEALSGDTVLIMDGKGTA